MALGGLGGVLAGHARIEIRPDLSTFGPKLRSELKGVLSSVGKFNTADFEGSFARVGGASAQLGKTLTKNLTLPLAGVGAVAFKMGADFDAVFAQMVGLAGVTAGEVDGLKESVLALAGETGRAPKELAQALYLASSAGLSASKALEVVTIAAKASAAGMGDSATIASVLTSTLNAYADSGLTAARAGDILTAAVKDGAAEAGDFAGAMGTVVPLAAQVGVSFDQVAASLAVLTKVGVSTDEAAVSMSAIFSGLLMASKSGSQADLALRSVGLTADGLRSDLAKPQGLLTVLREVDEAFGGDEAAMQSVFPNIRALRGALGLLGQNQEEVNKVFADAANPTGLLNDAFKLAADTAQFKLSKALAQAKVALVSLGENVAPVGTAVLGVGGAMARAFTDLPGPIKGVALGLGGVLAAAGPLAFVGGKVASSFGHIIGAAKGANNALVGFRIGMQGAESTLGGKLPSAAGRLVKSLGPAGVAGALGAVGVGLTVGMLALNEWQDAKESARQKVIAFTEALRQDGGELGANTRALIVNQATQDGLLGALAKLSGHLSSGRSAMDVYTDASLGNVASQKELTAAAKETGDSFAHLTHSGGVLAFMAKDNAKHFGDANKALKGEADQARTNADVDRDLAAAQTGLANLVASGTATEKQLGTARKKVADLTAERAAIDRELARATDTTTDAIKNQLTPLASLSDRLLATQQAADGAAAGAAAVAEAQQHLADVNADVRGVGPKSIDATNRHADALRGVRDAARSAAEAQETLAEIRADAAQFEDPTSSRIRELERTNIVHRIVSNPEEARQKEADLLKFDQDLAEKRGDFQKSIADAEDGVRDAAERVADAQEKVAEASEARRKVQVDAAKEVAQAERDVRTAVNGIVDALKQAQENKTPLAPWLAALREIDTLAAPGTPLRVFLDAILANAPAAPFTEHGAIAGAGAAPQPAGAAAAAAPAPAAATGAPFTFAPVYNLPPSERDLKAALEFAATKAAMHLENRGRPF